MPSFLVYPPSRGIDYPNNRDDYVNQTVNTELKNLSTECFMRVQHNDWNRDSIFSLPCYPETISESQGATWQQSAPLGRSSPISTYVGTGYRTFGLNFRLHREMCNGDEAYVDKLLVELRRTVFPYYIERGLMPPVTTFQFGQFRCKGYVENVSFSWIKPIIDGYYQCCDVGVNFVDVPDKVFSANTLNSVPTNPYNHKPLG